MVRDTRMCWSLLQNQSNQVTAPSAALLHRKEPYSVKTLMFPLLVSKEIFLACRCLLYLNLYPDFRKIGLVMTCIVKSAIQIKLY